MVVEDYFREGSAAYSCLPRNVGTTATQHQHAYQRSIDSRQLIQSQTGGFSCCDRRHRSSIIGVQPRIFFVSEMIRSNRNNSTHVDGGDMFAFPISNSRDNNGGRRSQNPSVIIVPFVHSHTAQLLFITHLSTYVYEENINILLAAPSTHLASLKQTAGCNR